MSTLKVADFIGRMLMALLFILAAVGKALPTAVPRSRTWPRTAYRRLCCRR